MKKSQFTWRWAGDGPGPTKGYRTKETPLGSAKPPKAPKSPPRGPKVLNTNDKLYRANIAPAKVAPDSVAEQRRRLPLFRPPNIYRNDQNYHEGIPDPPTAENCPQYIASASDDPSHAGNPADDGVPGPAPAADDSGSASGGSVDTVILVDDGGPGRAPPPDPSGDE